MPRLPDYEGTNQIQRTVIARELLRNGAADSTGYAALVTGSGRGIGKGIALALASEGFAIAVNDLTLGADVEQTVAELLAIGVRAVPVIGDVSDLEVHARMLDEAEAALGPLTTLVNNAGVGVLRRGDLLDVTPESFDRCQAVNARGGFFLTQDWAKRMLRQDRPAAFHHCVITITSSNAQAVSISRGEDPRLQGGGGHDGETVCRAPGSLRHRLLCHPARPDRNPDDGTRVG